MNFKLILLLSLFGLAMAIATVYVIPSNVELFIWLAIVGLCAYIIANKAPGKYFLHGFLVSIFNCVWVTGAHLLLFDAYMAHHPEETEMMNHFHNVNENIKMMMLITGPIIGIISGVVLGIFSYIGGRLVMRKRMSTT